MGKRKGGASSLDVVFGFRYGHDMPTSTAEMREYEDKQREERREEDRLEGLRREQRARDEQSRREQRRRQRDDAPAPAAAPQQQQQQPLPSPPPQQQQQPAAAPKEQPKERDRKDRKERKEKKEKKEKVKEPKEAREARKRAEREQRSGSRPAFDRPEYGYDYAYSHTPQARRDGHREDPAPEETPQQQAHPAHQAYEAPQDHEYVQEDTPHGHSDRHQTQHVPHEQVQEEDEYHMPFRGHEPPAYCEPGAPEVDAGPSVPQDAAHEGRHDEEDQGEQYDQQWWGDGAEQQSQQYDPWYDEPAAKADKAVMEKVDRVIAPPAAGRGAGWDEWGHEDRWGVPSGRDAQWDDRRATQDEEKEPGRPRGQEMWTPFSDTSPSFSGGRGLFSAADFQQPQSITAHDAAPGSGRGGSSRGGGRGGGRGATGRGGRGRSPGGAAPGSGRGGGGGRRRSRASGKSGGRGGGFDYDDREDYARDSIKVTGYMQPSLDLLNRQRFD